MTWLTVKTSGLSGRAKPDLICGKIFLFAISLLNYCTVSKIDIHVYNLLFITLWANSERCESAKIGRITNIKTVKNFFLVIKTAIINTQILTISIKSYYPDLSIWFIDPFFFNWNFTFHRFQQTRPENLIVAEYQTFNPWLDKPLDHIES